MATGRSVDSARFYAQQLPVNAPCILYNGSGIYDYQQETFIYTKFLPASCRQYAEKVFQRFPNVGAQALTTTTLFGVGNHQEVEKYMAMEHIDFVPCQLDQIEQELLKLVFVAEEEELPAIQEFLLSQNLEDVSFNHSGQVYFEMLPKNINKGAALELLCRSLEIPTSHVVAIGDFYNDLELLKAAGFSAVPKNAPDDLKQLCNLTVGDCNYGALADVVEFLEQAWE